MSSSKVREGTAWLLGAQVVFFASGYALNSFLGRRLGPEEFGLYGVVLFAANMIRTFVSSGVPIAVTKYISADPNQSEAVYRSGFRIQLPMAAVVSLLFFLLAEPLADLLGDPNLAPLFRTAAPLPLFFGLFFLIFQYFNGLKRYRRQSVLLSGSYLLRAALGILLVALGFGARGAVQGIVLAALIAWIWAAFVRRGATSPVVFPSKTLIQFSLPLILAAVVQGFITDLDVMFVKRLLPEHDSAGLYTSAKSLAQMTPIAFYALSSALYPAVSSAFAKGDRKLLTHYVQQANRLLLATVLPLIVVTACNAEAVIKLVYGNAYLEADGSLVWLTLSYGLLAAFIIHKTIITGCGHPRTAGLMTLLLLPLFVILQLVLTPRLDLIGAALASTITFAAGVVMSAAFLRMRLKAGLHFTSTLRILAAGGVVLLADLLLSYFSVPFLITLCVSAAIYLGMLKVTGELRGLNLMKDDNTSPDVKHEA